MIGKIIGYVVFILGILILSYLYFRKVRKLTRGQSFVIALVEGGLAGCIVSNLIHVAEAVSEQAANDYYSKNIIIISFMVVLFAIGMKPFDQKKHTDDFDEENEKIYQAEALGKAKKVCPFCGETILAVAIKCRYCGSDLTDPNEAEISNPAEPTAKMKPVGTFLTDLTEIMLQVDDNSGDEESEIEEKIYQAEALGKEKKICPYCGEEILAIAVKCRYCRSDLTEPKPSPAPASGLAGLDQGIDQTDILVNMENYGVAPDPKPIPDGIVDFRSTVWITSILIILGCVALGISYLSK
jgi:predicted RNA-binding Zn-ribbon protein involved in translation (DUF1610 family)